MLKGFIVGLALTIIVGQLPKLFGVEKSDGNFFEQAWGVIRHLGDTNWRTLVVGVLSPGGGARLQAVACPLVPRFPGRGAARYRRVGVFGLADKGVTIVGDDRSAACRRSGCRRRAAFDDYLDLPGRRWASLLVGFAEGLGAAKTYAAQGRLRVDANRELVGLGAANLGAGLCVGDGGQRQPVQDRGQRRRRGQVAGQSGWWSPC